MPCKVPGYRDVQIVGDCGTFTLTYTPDRPSGRPQTLTLDAGDESAALFEVSSLLECDEKLLTVEWC
jgi:hypothetical protein